MILVPLDPDAHQDDRPAGPAEHVPPPRRKPPLDSSPGHRTMSAAFEVPDVVEQYLGSSSADPRSAYSELSGWMKAEAKAGHWDKLAELLPRFVVPGLDYTSATSLGKMVGRVAEHAKVFDRTTKLAVLGGFTTHQLVDLIKLYLTAGRVNAEVYEADYGIFRQELLDPTSGVYATRPDSIFLATTWRDLGHLPALSDDRDEVRKKVEAEVADWSLLWRTAHDRLGCQILQNNFDAPPYRTLGNHEARHPSGFARYASLVNHALQDAAPPYVTIHDLDGLSSQWGRAQWGDERFYHHAKLPCPPELLVDYAHSVASLILAGLGLGKKCLVLDLDNTLWGGVIGDDGLGGIRIGQGEPEGEAFLSFQKYAKALRDRGVILAVCSKNTDSVAREVFEKHTEMALRMDDISCFVANWDDKATNLRKIAERLNIGLNSLVFADDNPAERLHPGHRTASVLPDPGPQRRGSPARRLLQGGRAAGRPRIVGRRPQGVPRIARDGRPGGTGRLVLARADRAVDRPVEPVQLDYPPPLRCRRHGDDGGTSVGHPDGLAPRPIRRQRPDQRLLRQAGWRRARD
jgi:HAD superfamily phosphatase (TIGR01681 family)